MGKVRTIRAAYICIGLAVLAVAWPELGMWAWPVVPMFFFPNCVCCGSCGKCTSTYAQQYQIDISGISDSTSDCLTCSNLNGTYIVDKLADPTTVFPGTLTNWCVSRYEIDPCACIGTGAQQEDGAQAVHSLFMFVIPDSPFFGDSLVRVAFTFNTGGSDCHVPSTALQTLVFLWQVVKTGGANCAGFSSESITFISESSSACASNSDPALVTAL